MRILKLRPLYHRLLLPFLHTSLSRQRVKLLAFCWSYWRLVMMQGLSIRERIRAIWHFLVIDWNVPHAHNPAE